MNKEQIIAFIVEQLSTGKITKDDLREISGGVSAPQTQFAPVFAGSPEPIQEEHSKNLTNVFYGIGAVIAIVGVGILIAQNWNEIGFGGRILVTLGISFLAYALGFVLHKPEQKTLSQVMFSISCALAPLGLYVLFDQAGIEFTRTIGLAVSAVLFVVYGTAFYITKRNILILISIGYASSTYYTLIMEMFDTDFGDIDIFKWATMLLGVSYLFIGYGISSLLQPADVQDEREKKSIENILYGLGTLAILGIGITMGGIFDLVLIAFIFGAFYGSVYLKSRAMLILGAIFLMAQIINLTSQYFVDSIGWPIALIFVGFLVIGIGYGTFYVNKKYISG